MKLLHQCFAIGALALGLASCSQDAPWGSGDESGVGAIDVRLLASSDVKASVPAVRAVSSEITTPPIDDFSVKLTKDDGSYNKTWTSLGDFTKEDSFPVGSYSMEVFYGSPESQGKAIEGKEWENAYYYGISENVTVLEWQTTQVHMQAALANAIVVIEYSDAFKKYFKNWSTTVQTAGKEAINLEGNEALNYVVPGDMNVVIKVEQQNGKTSTLNPATFVTEPCHMYKLRYNVFNDQVAGVDKLEIVFDEALETEPIVVDLSAELGTTPAPVVSAEGFDLAQTYVTQVGTPFEHEVKFNVVARGGIKEANLTISSDDYRPDFLDNNGVIDLCSADEATQAKLKAAGINAVGFYRNPGEMAKLDLTEFCHRLPEGLFKISLQVKDALTQVNELPEESPMLTISSQSVIMDMVQYQPAPFGEGYAEVLVGYNGPDPTQPGANPFHFHVQNDYNYTLCDVISVTEKKDTRAFERKEYIYRIKIPEVNRDKFEVMAYFGEHDPSTPPKSLTTEVEFAYPDYKVELDPMTKKLRIRTSALENGEEKVGEDDKSRNTLFFHKLNIFLNGKRLDINKKEFSRDEPTGLIAIYDLEASTQYRIQTTLQSAENATKFGSDATITTSPASPVPNGDFSQTEETINQKLRVGGTWLCGAITYHTDCKFQYSEPSGSWTSINKKTFYKDAVEKNSWFMVASTFMESGSAVIRTVGYNHNGKTPDRTGSFLSVTHYNTSAPDYDSFTRSSGELFLGSYDFNGTESRNYGVNFNARPTSLTFSYKYEPQQSVSRGSAEIILYGSDGKTVINSRKMYLYKTDNMTDYTIVLHRYPFGVAPGKLCIRFLSSDLEEGNSIETKYPTGKALDEGKGLNNDDIATNSAHALCVGSVLTVSNLRFNYGEKQND